MKNLLFAIVLCSTLSLSAQKMNVVAEGIAPNLYLTHIVTPKENYYSIGRLYNQAPKAIAGFNHTTLEKGLAVGQTLKIPLNTMNYDVSGMNTADETLVPVYHIVSKNETLFRIGNNHATGLDNLRKWNNLQNDIIEIGTPLVIGYLKVKNTEIAAFNAIPSSSLPLPANVTPASVNSTAAPVPANELPNGAGNTGAEIIKTSSATVSIPEKTKDLPAPPVTDTGSVKEEVKYAVTPPPAGKEKEQAVITAKEIPAPAPAVEATAPAGTITGLPAPPVEEGVFGSQYATESASGSLVNKAGEAGTFKSTSGWQDKKYYVLINDVVPGTIVRISTQDKTLYAKVLGNLPETKDSKNMLLRMSSAAASYLGIIDPKFQVQVSYYE